MMDVVDLIIRCRLFRSPYKYQSFLLKMTGRSTMAEGATDMKTDWQKTQ